MYFYVVGMENNYSPKNTCVHVFSFSKGCRSDCRPEYSRGAEAVFLKAPSGFYLNYFFCKGARTKLGRRHSMENMELMKLTPEKVGHFYVLNFMNCYSILVNFSLNEIV